MTIAFVSDGAPGQFLGIAVVLRAFSRHPNAKGRPIAVKLVVPPSEFGPARLWFALPRTPFDLALVPARVSATDRYFVQLALAEAFALCEPNDMVICVDYDHVPIEVHRLPLSVAQGTVLASSEVYDSVPSGLRRQMGNHQDLRLNTSLLMGAARDLRRIGDAWESAYYRLLDLVPQRHLVEIAFGLAAMEAAVHVAPCPSAVQGNFANPTQACALFHYGGDAPGSLKMKKLLTDLAARMDPTTATEMDLDLATTAMSDCLAHELSGRDCG